ncbi:MAG: WD40 repeat domain-containing protein, partial [Streptosporangiaceae bacterium]
HIYVIVSHVGAWVQSVAFSPDGALLASGGDDAVARVWEARTGRQLAELTGNSDRVLSVAFSPDGTALAAAGNVTPRVWHLQNGIPVRETTFGAPGWRGRVRQWI